MKTAIIRIGNSKGIRLSKVLLAKYKIEDEVELILEPEAIIIKPLSKPRQDWESAFAKKHPKESDPMLIDDVLDENDWAE